MKKALLISLLAIVAVACGKDADRESVNEGDVYFSILPTVAGSSVTGEIDTKTRVDGAFAVGSRVGLSMVSDNITLNERYKNFSAVYNGTAWSYYFGTSNYGTQLSGFASWGNVTLYGYYPYRDNLTDIENIPFSLGTISSGEATAIEDDVLMDHMVAKTESKSMTGGGSMVSLKFDHLFTSIVLKIRRLYLNGPSLTLSKVTYEIIDGSGREFGIAGTYKAKDPDMSNMSSNVRVNESASKLTVDYSSASWAVTSINYPASIKDYPTLIIMPEMRQTLDTPGEDATVRLTLGFTDTNGSPFVFEEANAGTLTFKLSDIGNPYDDNGLLAGKSYVIQAEIGTYVKFAGKPILVDDPLEDADNSGNEHIEI